MDTSPSGDVDRDHLQISDEAVYEEAHRLATLAITDLERQIGSSLTKLGDPHLIRARMSPPRIKTLESLRRKAAEREWSVSQALARARDVIGFRIVCNNLQDARRAYELLRRALTSAGLKLGSHDYVKQPRPDGYRAIHLWFPYEIQVGVTRMTLHCEVQIHSLLQDAWAKLSRMDIYRTDARPPLAKAMKQLSDRLHKADKLADGIRSRLARPHRGRKPAAGAPITAPAVAFLYRHAFGADPPDYLVQSTLEELAATPIRTDGLASLLDDKDFFGKLADSYREANRLDFDADPAQVFRWAVHAAVHGREAAIREARAAGRDEWRYVDQIYRSEALSNLPDNADEFVRFITRESDDGDPYSDLLTWAQALGAVQECMCGTKLVDEDSLADSLVRRYRLRGARAERSRERIIAAVINSGVETSVGSGLCSYCSHVLSKDD